MAVYDPGKTTYGLSPILIDAANQAVGRSSVVSIVPASAAARYYASTSRTKSHGPPTPDLNNRADFSFAREDVSNIEHRHALGAYCLAIQRNKK
jgi:hypothetical protein